MPWPSISHLTSLYPDQLRAATAATTGQIGALIGGPGTGKTHTVGELLRVVANHAGLDSIAVAAPTGKAAVRLTESLQRAGLPIEAVTCHRLLGVTRNGHDGKGWGFHYGVHEQLPHRFLVVDESSMVDTDLAASVMRAVPDDGHVLLVGDTGQLPPVGHGRPFFDMIESGIPAGELTQIRRNAGAIVHACRDIREGRRFLTSPMAWSEHGQNLVHMERMTPQMQLTTLKSLLLSTPDSIDPVWDVQVLTTLNDNTPVSRVHLNRELQTILNPHGLSLSGSEFRVGDKVICTSNGFLPLWHERLQQVLDQEDFVANGEIGRVVKVVNDAAVKKRMMLVRFDAPSRTVAVKGVAINDKFSLAYAITTHKSQGSQAPVIIFMVDSARGARRIACRELVYTALSRAEQMCVTIGKRAIIDQDCRRVALAGRKTFLKERILEFRRSIDREVDSDEQVEEVA